MMLAFALIAVGVACGALAVEALRCRMLVRRLRGIAMSCHELRGALTAIDLALSKAERCSSASVRFDLEAVRHGYERAAAVVHDLEVARGALPAHVVRRPEIVDLQQVASRVVRTWNESLPPGAQPITLEWRAGAVRVHGFPMRLVQALDNLVANALEHGRGPVRVVGAVRGGWVSVCVVDRGAGLRLPLEVRPLPSWRARRGHGLLIARQAVELHGGTLRPVQSALGFGIEIRLPAMDGRVPVRSRARPTSPHRSGSGATAS